DPLTRDLYVARVAEAAGVTRALLEREIGEAQPARFRDRPSDEMRIPTAEGRRGAPVSRPIPKVRASLRSARAEHELIRVVLHRREYVERVLERLGPSDLADPTLAAIYAGIAAVGADGSIEQLAAGLSLEAAERLQELL